MCRHCQYRESVDSAPCCRPASAARNGNARLSSARSPLAAVDNALASVAKSKPGLKRRSALERESTAGALDFGVQVQFSAKPKLED